MARTAEDATELWKSLTEYCKDWWYKPDIEALEIAIASCLAHFALNTDPVWLFMVGASGSGKTSLLINSLSALPNTRILGDLSVNSLMSGYGSKKRNSLLHRTGKHGIWLFKDFTTFLSKRDEARRELASYLREIHDGKFTAARGTGEIPEWEGKITVVAAVTPALERAWATLRDLGERFMTIRWRHGDPEGASEAAARQIGHEHEIHEGLLQRTKELFDIGSLAPASSPSPAFLAKTFKLAQYSSWLRSHVIRDNQGKREIIDLPEREFPTRLTKAMQIIPCYYAALRSSSEPSVHLAQRLALDSIPTRRLAFIDAIPNNAKISSSDLRELTQLPTSTIDWVAEELVAMKAIEDTETDLHRYFQLTESFAKLKLEALSEA